MEENLNPLQSKEEENPSINSRNGILGTKETDELDGQASNETGENNEANTQNLDSSNVVRQRVKTNSRQVETTSATNRNDVESQNGTCSLVLLWIVVIALFILILRRLCMDPVTISKS